MTQQHAIDFQQQKQQQQQRSQKEKEQDIKNAEYMARVGQPNHPNT